MNLTGLSPLLSHLWQSTLCVGAAWLLATSLRKHRASIRYGIWFVASMKFLIPFSLLAGFGDRFARIAAPVRQPRLSAVMTQLSRPFVVNASSPLAATARSSPHVPPSAWPEYLVLAVWLCGVAVSLFFWSRWWFRMRSITHAAVPLALDLPIAVVSSSAGLEPGVFGIFRPVLLLPEGIAQRLSPEQLESVLAHELCHVRRCDNLTAALHLAVETIFWFYPLVWWIESRLVRERELACDEAVVSASIAPHAYAEGILEVCKLYLKSPAIVAGISGADLKERVEHILSGACTRQLGLAGRLLLAATGLATLALPLAAGVFRVAAQPSLSASAAPSSRPGRQDSPRDLIKIPGDLQQASCLSCPEPPYPESARAAHVEGDVVFQAIIGADGRVQALALISGNDLLVPAAKRAVQQWRYTPLVIGGKAVTVETTITVKFQADGNVPVSGNAIAQTGVTAPVLLFSPDGKYTDAAKSAGIQGAVNLEVVVDSQGQVKSATVVDGLGYGLDEEAVAAVKRWRFKPGLYQGRPVQVQVEIQMKFPSSAPQPPGGGVAAAQSPFGEGVQVLSDSQGVDSSNYLQEAVRNHWRAKMPAGVQILSDTQGVDFSAYLQGVSQAVGKHWFAAMPEAVYEAHKGKVAIVFDIAANGTVSGLHTVAGSGDASLDQAAAAAISASNPLPALPAAFHGPSISLQFSFFYNMGPN